MAWRREKARREPVAVGYAAMRRCALVAVLASVCLAGYAGEAPEERTEQADPSLDQRPPAREPVPTDEPAKPAAQTRVSLEDATAIVRQAYGGRVVSAAAARARPERARREPSAGEREGLAPRKQESGYRVRVDVDGRVKTVFVDARGRIHENAEY